MTNITLSGLRKAFGVTDILKGVDLHIRGGEFVVILGPSGCGKSTLLRLIAGLEHKSAGSIQIGETEVSGLEPKDRGCAMVFQNYALYPHMTVAENIAYSLRVEGLPRAERRRRAERTAKLVQLDGLLDRKPSELSGGQRQRVAMARAIIRSPSVFLFDEPLSNLDAELRVQMRHEVRRIHEDVGATSVYVTHDQVEAMTLADRLVVMRDGEIQQVGTPSEVYETPRSLYIARFIGSPSMGTIPATYWGEAGTILLSDGQQIALPGRSEHLRDGAAVVVGIRPEALRFGMVGATLTATHQLSEELGNARLHHLRVAGETVPIVTPDKRQLSKGDPVEVCFDPDDLHLFDAYTGLRLD
ncbi:sn-glycerol-3-phosphate ABC transporter ATP-binding protein UgpC [Rhodobacteraceae bacterium N5(2021)]|uniref:Sn-glycerol-3-phosphate ABC transporter ATP-binding protein UgpC n=1 Tax=Gymnodinialimonas phycosphaerae TaxID=2841589 RepID=A0A975TRA2_9RHOB|nr:sn-glycerol-3-phosphate ABC transporter ATP-binding protein UgpC [Gymnodinialimonas phycosphaerae]MBY4893523.1 sn-glycerol-3-phosphate ABC transporter ATP-binding protein UgpC [Gymnodinialimonas phycosphaerae]